MATLQNIRNRGGLLVSVIIGLALIAFIAGDALSSGSAIFGTRNQAGVVAGESISIMDYQKEILKNEEFLKMMHNVSALNEQQQNDVREETWQQIVNGLVMGREYEELGIEVTSEELFDMLLGNNMHPVIKQLFGNADQGQIREYVKYLMSLNDNDPQKSYWLNLEEQLADNRKSIKYNSLLSKGLYVTNAEAQATLNNNVNKADISYVVRNYASVSDSAVSISNNEIKEYYNSHKNLFQQQESRRIAYVNFDITPSADDYSETRKWINSLKEEFETTDNAVEFVDLSSDVKFDATYYRKDEITNDSLADFLFASDKGVYGPYMENQTYKISRIASTKMLPDSVRARHILIAPENNNYAVAKHIADSLADLLRKGADFEAFARQYSTDQGSAVNGGDLGWFGPKAMVQPFSDTAFFANTNEIKVAVTQFGAHIIQVRNRAKLVKKIQIASIAKEIVPSQATINKTYNQARAFATDVKTVADFDKKVQETGTTKRYASVNKNNRLIADITDARDIVRQVYLSKKVNEVVLNNEGSNIFDTGDRFVVTVLTEINEEGFSPLNAVSVSIKQELIRRKKAEIIKKEMTDAISGSQSLLSVAQKFYASVREATDLSFTSLQIPGAGIEPKVIATAMTLEENKMSAPIEGNTGVYVIVVNNRNVNEAIDATDIEGTRTGMQQSVAYKATYQAPQALMKQAEVKDSRYKFF